MSMTVCQVYAVDKVEVSWCQELIITSSSAAAPCIIPTPTVGPNKQLAGEASGPQRFWTASQGFISSYKMLCLCNILFEVRVSVGGVSTKDMN